MQLDTNRETSRPPTYGTSFGLTRGDAHGRWTRKVALAGGGSHIVREQPSHEKRLE